MIAVMNINRPRPERISSERLGRATISRFKGGRLMPLRARAYSYTWESLRVRASISSDPGISGNPRVYGLDKRSLSLSSARAQVHVNADA